MQGKAYISACVRDFRDGHQPAKLAQGLLLVIRQGRLLELLYGAYCTLVHSPSPLHPRRGDAMLDGILAGKHGFTRFGVVRRRELRERFGEHFPIDALPADFERVRWESVLQAGQRLILGEYGENSRIACLGTGTCVLSEHYAGIQGVRHIHALAKYGDRGEFLVCTGDSAKLLDLWSIGDGRPAFLRRLRHRLAGYTAAAEVGGRHYFGTDFSSRPNYLESLDGRKHFFPRKAYRLHVSALFPAGDRYLVAIHQELDVLGGRRAMSVFDTREEKFLFCDFVDLPQPAGDPAGAQWRHAGQLLALVAGAVSLRPDLGWLLTEL